MTRLNYLNRTSLCIAVFSSCLLASASTAQSSEHQYGDAAFYPSPSQPLGFLADGGGHYPAAQPPVDFDSTTDAGILWKTPVPAGMAQPLQIGEKIIVSCAPWTVMCLNAHDGSVLWETPFPAWRDMPAQLADSCADEWKYFRSQQNDYATWREKALLLQNRMHKEKLNPKKFSLYSTNGKAKPVPIEDPEFQKKLAESQKHARANGYVLHGFGNDDLVIGTFWQEWSNTVARLYNLYNWSRWWGFTTSAYMTPVTDGEHIYLPSVMNQIVCMDLYGNIKWTRWLPSDSTMTSPNLGTRFVKSPFLHQDFLIWRGDSRLTVLNKHTGEQIWRHAIHGKSVSLGHARPAPECTHPAIITLADGTAAVLDPVGDLFDLATGAKLAHLAPQRMEMAVTSNHFR